MCGRHPMNLLIKEYFYIVLAHNKHIFISNHQKIRILTSEMQLDKLDGYTYFPCISVTSLISINTCKGGGKREKGKRKEGGSERTRNSAPCPTLEGPTVTC